MSCMVSTGSNLQDVVRHLPLERHSGVSTDRQGRVWTRRDPRAHLRRWWTRPLDREAQGDSTGRFRAVLLIPEAVTALSRPDQSVAGVPLGGCRAPSKPRVATG